MGKMLFHLHILIKNQWKYREVQALPKKDIVPANSQNSKRHKIISLLDELKMCYFLLNMAPFFAGANSQNEYCLGKKNGSISFSSLQASHLSRTINSRLFAHGTLLGRVGVSQKKQTIREQIFSVKKVVRILPHFGWQKAYSSLQSSCRFLF